MKKRVKIVFALIIQSDPHKLQFLHFFACFMIIIEIWLELREGKKSTEKVHAIACKNGIMNSLYGTTVRNLIRFYLT